MRGARKGMEFKPKCSVWSKQEQSVKCLVWLISYKDSLSTAVVITPGASSNIPVRQWVV